MSVPPAAVAWAVDMRLRFRGLTRREGMVLRGGAGWGEWSPFWDYRGTELLPWLAAAEEAAHRGWPEPVRDRVDVNVTVPALPAAAAARLAGESDCRTAKIKVAEPGQTLAEDLDRVAAVRRALGSDGRVRVDANGGWDVDQAFGALVRLAAYDLEYAEQPCASVAELAELRERLDRAGTPVLIAADESIRRAEDPLAVARTGAADVAVLKVQPLGGVRACLRIAEHIGLPVVVSSALETSIGLRAGLALAAALPELPFACGLNTGPLLADDLAADPLVAEAGQLTVRPVELDLDRLDRCRADAGVTRDWQDRLAATAALRGGAA